MPDEMDIVRAGAEGATKGAIDSISEPFKALVAEFCAEIGEGFGYYGRYFRQKMGLRVMQKTKKLLQDAGISPSSVSPKLFFSILESASLEDNEQLQGLWAALLANAANPSERNKVHPAFVGILKDLTPGEADLLNNIYYHVREQVMMAGMPLHSSSAQYIDLTEPMEANGTLHFLDASELQPIIDRLKGVGLLKKDDSAILINNERVGPEANFNMTAFGFEFITACRPPSSIRSESGPEKS